MNGLAEEDALYRAVGERIRKLRRSHPMTQDDLAAAVALSRPSIVNIEAGRQHLSLHLLVRIACALGVQPCLLLSAVNEPAPDYLERSLAAETKVIELEKKLEKVRQRAERLFR